MRKKFYTVAWSIIALCFVGMYFLTKDDPKPDANKTEQVKKSDTKKASSSENEQTSFESDIKKLGVFDAVEYNAENDAFIISEDINATFGDKKAIEYFNSDIRQILDKGLYSDKPVAFRAWDGKNAASIVYFTTDKFNQDWKSENLLDSDTYTKSSGWMSMSKFGQYQSANDKADDNATAEKIFNIFQLSK